MAARRLLIVMLVLLGLSTLAAALVPQHALRSPSATRTTTTPQTAPTTTTTKAPPTGKSFSFQITVGGPQVVVDCSAARQRKGSCDPIRVGDRVSLAVYSRRPAQLSIPALGQIGFAAPNAPALFELLPERADVYGIVFEPSGRIAARIRVEPRKAPKPRARGGSGRP